MIKKQAQGIFKNLAKNFAAVLLIFLIISAVFALLAQPFEQKNTISLTRLAADINDEKIKKLTVSGNEISAIYQDESQTKSRKETEIAFSETLFNYGVAKENLKNLEIEVKEEGGALAWLGPISVFLFPLLIFFLFFWLIFRQAKTGAMQAFDFTKARSRLFGAEGHPKEKISFQDVAGLKEAKEELKEVVDFLKNPKKYLQMGARIPKGVLLMGPAGCGKTLLARAVAGESNVPFISIAGSSLVELFVGVGASRIRDLFSTAKKHQPCIIFFDELDTIGKVRGPAITGGHEEREQTLNQLLADMDGFEPNDKIIVLAATNRPAVLDPALLRPGRFDRKVVLDLPDINEREDVLKIHSRGKPLDPNVKLREVAERTPGFSGADLANLVNEAAIFAARKNKPRIYQEEMLESIEKVLLGPERKSHILSKDEKEIAAFHEAGHALVAASLPGAEPVRKISIIARGRAAGYTLKLPIEDRHLKNKSEFLAELAMLLGGYVAEKIVFKEVTTGAASDLDKASALARKLIKEYGMSEKLGPVVFGEKEEMIFLGRDFGEQRNYSEQIAAKIDEETTKLIKNAQTTAEKILGKKKGLLTKIAKTLIEKETIEREEFEALLKLPARSYSATEKKDGISTASSQTAPSKQENPAEKPRKAAGKTRRLKKFKIKTIK